MAAVLPTSIEHIRESDRVSWLSNGQFSPTLPSKDIKFNAPGFPPLMIRIESIPSPRSSSTSTPVVDGEVDLDRIENKSEHEQVKEAPLGMTTTNLSAATRLRAMIDYTDKLIVCPGVYDGFSARIAMSLGFDALYMVCLAAALDLFTCSLYHYRPELEQQLHVSAWLISASPNSMIWPRMPK
jgi:hypothetical protein